MEGWGYIFVHSSTVLLLIVRSVVLLRPDGWQIARDRDTHTQCHIDRGGAGGGDWLALSTQVHPHFRLSNKEG